MSKLVLRMQQRNLALCHELIFVLLLFMFCRIDRLLLYLLPGGRIYRAFFSRGSRKFSSQNNCIVASLSTFVQSWVEGPMRNVIRDEACIYRLESRKLWHFRILTLLKIHILKFSLLTKFTFSKSHYSQNSSF